MSADALQLRRAVRVLLRQRGGTMLTTLPACGVKLRVECTLASRGASIDVSCEATVTAEDVDMIARFAPAVRMECDRARCRMDRFECAVPATAEALPRAA
jgi:hypothetical protein